MTKRVLAAVALAALVGCGTGTRPATTSPAALVTLTTSATHTNGTVTVQVDVSGNADKVELLIDGKPTTLAAPYTYTWDTAGTPEGAHELRARITKGTTTSTSAAKTVIVDRTAPAIASRTPAPDATNVPVREPITIKFSEPIKASTVTDANLQLASSWSVVYGKTLSLSPDGRTLTVTTIGSPDIPTSLTLALTSNITDLAGNALNSASWSWSVPDWLDLGMLSAFTGDTAARDPSLDLDADGNPVVAWLEYGGAFTNDNADLFVRRWTGSAWEALGEPLSATAGITPVENPRLALDGAGTPVVAWAEFSMFSGTNGYYVYVRRWTGSEWQAVGERLTARPDYPDARLPALALDSAGNPVVAWREQNRIHVRRWTGSSWIAVGEAFEFSAIWAPAPVLVLDHSGNPIVAWYDDAGQVHVQRWMGSTWAALGGPLSVNSRARVPRLTVDAAGNPIVAWTEDGNIHVRWWTGRAWAEIVRPNDVAPAFVSSLDADSSGNPTMAWNESDGTTFNLRTKRWTGQAWEEVGEALSAYAGVTPTNAPVLKLDGNGNAVVAWHESDGTTSEFYGTIWDVHVRRLNR